MVGIKNKTLIILLAVILLYVCTCTRKRENFVEVFGGAGYSTPVSEININVDSGVSTREYKISYEAITPDEVNICVTNLSNLVKEQTGICNTVVETNRMQVYKNKKGDKLFKCAFMFMTTKTGFPFGFSIDADILEDGRILRANTEPMKTMTHIKPFSGELSPTENFLPAKDLFEKRNLVKT